MVWFKVGSLRSALCFEWVSLYSSDSSSWSSTVFRGLRTEFIASGSPTQWSSSREVRQSPFTLSLEPFELLPLCPLESFLRSPGDVRGEEVLLPTLRELLNGFLNVGLWARRHREYSPTVTAGELRIFVDAQKSPRTAKRYVFKFFRLSPPPVSDVSPSCKSDKTMA